MKPLHEYLAVSVHRASLLGLHPAAERHAIQLARERLARFIATEATKQSDTENGSVREYRLEVYVIPPADLWQMIHHEARQIANQMTRGNT